MPIGNSAVWIPSCAGRTEKIIVKPCAGKRHARFERGYDGNGSASLIPRHHLPMRFNRSVPPCAVIPVLIYPNPSAAADWLAKAFGFTIRLRIANHRIQMKAGEGCVTIAEGNAPPNNSHIVQVRIEDANGHCERARQNGAVVLTEPRDQPYGERQYHAHDFYGHRWDFTETINDVAPEEWSSGAFHLE